MQRTPTKYTQNTPQDTNKHSVKYQRSPTKWGANTPPGVGTDSSRPYPNIIKNVYSRHQIRVFTSSNTHIHFTKYAFPHYCIRVSISPHTCFRSSFYGCIPIHGRNKSAPAAANSLPIMLLTDCNNTTFKKQNPYFRNVKTPFLQFKRVVFIILKECFLQTKKVVFAGQKGSFCRPKKCGS